MPEGDTIFRTAAALRAALLGRSVTAIRASRPLRPMPRVGAVIEEVRSVGKHLEIVWDDGIVLHTHMRMTGAWHLYRHGEPWRKAASRARVVIEVADWIAVCFSAPVVETHRDFDPRRHPILGRLGPDLCRDDADVDEAVSRMLAYEAPDATIAEVLLDQRVACGVGNVYRCEVLWACELHPWATVGTLSRDECRELVSLAAAMLRANLGGPSRVTAPKVPGGLAVYGRHGRHCPRCRDLVRVTHHGEANRVLYWCDGCQTRHSELPVRAPRTAEGQPTHPAERRWLDEVRDARARSSRSTR
jgi:endonuclease-8